MIESAWDAHSKDIERVIATALKLEEFAVLFKLLGPIRREARKEVERSRSQRHPR